MSNYLVRSMSTFNYMEPGSGVEAPPYHVYLLKPERRRMSTWSGYCGNCAQYETVDEALVAGGVAAPGVSFDVVPVNDLALPTWWDVRAGSPGARWIGDRVVGGGLQ